MKNLIFHILPLLNDKFHEILLCVIRVCVCLSVGLSVGSSVRRSVGPSVRSSVGRSVGPYVRMSRVIFEGEKNVY